MLNVAQELDEMKINDKNQQTWGRIPCLTKLPRRGGGGRETGGLNSLSCPWAQGFRPQDGARSGDKVKRPAQLG